MHIHTICSDGTLTPEDVVNLAEKAGLGLIAVTDHDTVSACADVARLAEGRGIKTVTGIEVSAYDNLIKFHTLKRSSRHFSADFSKARSSARRT